MTLKFKMLFALLFVAFIFVRAQEKDTTKKSFVDSVKALADTAKVKTTDSSKTNATDTAKANVDSFYSTTSTAKVIKKIEDPRLGLSYEFIARIKRMKPNQLLIIDEKAVRNEKRVDEYGLEYEATVAVRFSFSQDMITGIVKETPLYNTAGRETNIIDVKIPIKFCCTTPIDTVHKKKHCGKMSELNDFEDNEGCKDWVQVEAGSGGSKKSTGKPVVKGKGRTGQTSVTGESDDDDDEEVDKFGKPISKKKKKKGKKSKQQLEDENIEVSDSTTVNYQDSVVTDKSKKTGKKVKESKKKKNDESFGKPTKKDKNNKSKSNDDDDENENEKTHNEANKNQEDSIGVAPPKQEVQNNKEEKKENKKEEKQTKQKKDNSTDEDEAASFKKENKKEKKKKNKEKSSEVNVTDTTSKASKEIIEDKKEDSKNDSSSEEEVTTDKKTKKKEKKKKKEDERKKEEKKENEIDG